MNDAQPFHIYGTSRIRDEDALPRNPLEVIVNEGTGEIAGTSPVRSVAESVRMEPEDAITELAPGD